MSQENKKTKKQEETKESQQKHGVNEEIEVLRQELTNLQEKNFEIENKMKRALADYMNLQARVERDRGKFIELAKEEVVLDFLPVLDNLERAAKTIKDEGLAFVIKQFNTVLETQGLSSLGEIGEIFDPHKHECIEVVEGEKDSVVEVLEQGFQMGERVIRAAKVKVGNK